MFHRIMYSYLGFVIGTIGTSFYYKKKLNYFSDLLIKDAVITENEKIIKHLEKCENEIQRAELKNQLKKNLEYIKTL